MALGQLTAYVPKSHDALVIFARIGAGTVLVGPVGQLLHFHGPPKDLERSDNNNDYDLVQHTDIQLPGLRNPIAYAKLMVALAFAYSVRGNARRLEDHFYAFWELVMDNLVFDDAYLVVAPQMTLWMGKECAHP
ncbi:hypothetical protein C0993_007140, partial [Termitomyces sp. T159_Od127]